MCEKIGRLGLPIVKIHFCKYTARPQDQVDRDRRYGGFGNGLPMSDDYHLLFELNDGTESRENNFGGGKFVEYNSEAVFINRPREVGKAYPGIEGLEADLVSCYTIEVSNGTDIRVVYNILKSIFTKYRALEYPFNDNYNYFDLSELFVYIYNSNWSLDNDYLLIANNLQRVFYDIHQEQIAAAVEAAEDPDLGGGSGNKRRKVTKKRKNRVYVSGKKNKNNSRKK